MPHLRRTSRQREHLGCNDFSAVQLRVPLEQRRCCRGRQWQILEIAPPPPSFSSLPSVVTWRPAKQVYILEHDKVARPDTASSLCVCMYLCPCIYMHVCIQSRGRGASACVNVSCSVPVMASLQTDRVYSFSRILSFSLCVSLSHTHYLSLSLSLSVCACVCMSVCLYLYISVSIDTLGF